jgi:pyruvate ferredoxin oxidoreductase gamma subunit
VIASEINNKNCKIYTIDASGIAKELFGKNLPNTVIVGSIAKLIPSVSHKDVVRKLKEKFDAKLSEEVVRKNIEALERGYGAF